MNMLADIAHGHTATADVAFLVAVIACALALVGLVAKRATTDVALALTVALGAVAFGLLVL